MSVGTRLQRNTYAKELIPAVKVFDRLLSTPQYQSAKRIAIYLSMPLGEIQTRPIVEDAIRRGKRVFVPFIYSQRVVGNEKPLSVMDMVSLHSQHDYDSLERDRWGIPTPGQASMAARENCLGDDAITPSDQITETGGYGDLDMILMPGVAFDLGCRRLGHGKGYYDFFLSRYHQTRAARHLTASSKKVPLESPSATKQTTSNPTSTNPHDTMRTARPEPENPSRHTMVVMPYLSQYPHGRLKLPSYGTKRYSTVGLGLEQQILPQGQFVPTDARDWQLDGLLVGNGSLVE